MQENDSKLNSLPSKIDEIIIDVKMTAQKFERDSIKAKKDKN